MLIDIDSGKTIGRVPYQAEFDILRNRLSVTEFDRMGSGRYQLDCKEIGSRTYFRLRG